MYKNIDLLNIPETKKKKRFAPSLFRRWANKINATLSMLSLAIKLKMPKGVPNIGNKPLIIGILALGFFLLIGIGTTIYWMIKLISVYTNFFLLTSGIIILLYSVRRIIKIFKQKK